MIIDHRNTQAILRSHFPLPNSLTMFDPKSQYFYTLNSPTTHKNRNYNNLVNRNISARVKKTTQGYENCVRVNAGDVQFRAQNTDDESDVCSPPLWKSSSPTNYGSLSPNSRSRAIAKGQKELMEMARNMPETCYELSLRDMVESPVIESPRLDDEEKCLVNEKNRKSLKEIVKRQESNKVEKRMDRIRSASIENRGLFLKMVFPISIRPKGKKKLGMSTSKRVTQKVETLGKPSSEKDWWKKRFSGSSGSESTESGVTNTNSDSSKSTNSNSSGSGRGRGHGRDSRKNTSSGRSNGWSSACWSFGFSRKNKRKSK